MANEKTLTINGVVLSPRESDNYVPATTLCKAAGKKWGHYWENDGTQDFIQALAVSIGIPADRLVQIATRTRNDLRGTWIHPRVVIHFAQWVSPEFAVDVSGWVLSLLTTGEARMTAAEADRYENFADMLRQFEARSEERIRALEERVATIPAGPRSMNVGPLWTVQDILNEGGWHTTSARQRANIRDRANRVIRTHTGQEVEQLNGYSVYTRSQVPFVDSSIRIEKMRAELAEAERGLGLFEGVSEAA